MFNLKCNFASAGPEFENDESQCTLGGARNNMSEDTESNLNIYHTLQYSMKNGPPIIFSQSTDSPKTSSYAIAQENGKISYLYIMILFYFA